jgi:alkylation response protein AidB-like acyl-CoA dehydrogenase
MGNLSSEIAEVVLNDVLVPEDALLGEERGAFKKVQRNLNIGRVLVGAGAIGVGQAALDSAIAYAKDRTAFGKTIGSYQGVSFPLARAKATLDAARLAVYRAAWMWDEGRDPIVETSIAKYLGAEAGVEVTDAAIRTFGGYGYMRESPVERHYRDARYFAIVEGTQEIQLRIISKLLGL